MALTPATSPAAAAAEAPLPGSYARGGLLRDGWRRLRRDKMGMIGLTVTALFVLIAIFGPFFAPYNPNVGDFSQINKGVSWSHPLGTDELGRDLLSRILAGMRTGLMVAFFVTLFSHLIGITLGSIAGYFGGIHDTIIGRLIDFCAAFPTLLLAVFVAATVGPFINRHLTGDPDSSATIEYVVVCASLSLVVWEGSARLIRGQLLSLREREFVLAARAEGAKGRWIISKHLFPNAAGPLIVSVSLTFGGALLLEAALSFLGIGIRPPQASLGGMINEYLTQWRYHPRLVLAPACVLAIVLVAMSLVGDAVNDALDPRRRR
jgi:ABC-type dipeptide/oligopeptide/nickel transport system permease subunit